MSAETSAALLEKTVRLMISKMASDFDTNISEENIDEEIETYLQNLLTNSLYRQLLILFNDRGIPPNHFLYVALHAQDSQPSDSNILIHPIMSSERPSSVPNDRELGTMLLDRRSTQEEVLAMLANILREIVLVGQIDKAKTEIAIRPEKVHFNAPDIGELSNEASLQSIAAQLDMLKLAIYSQKRQLHGLANKASSPHREKPITLQELKQTDTYKISFIVLYALSTQLVKSVATHSKDRKEIITIRLAANKTGIQSDIFIVLSNPGEETFGLLRNDVSLTAELLAIRIAEALLNLNDVSIRVE